MSKPKRELWCIGCLAMLAVCATPAARLKADDASTAAQILATCGVRAGLCVHVGCGREQSPGLTAELAAGTGLLVHGVCFDAGALQRAQAAIVAKGVLGQASVERVSGGSLPYVTHLCNLIVVEDTQVPAAAGIGREELTRVLAPDGVLCIHEDGRWRATVRPRPEGMDDWTHPNHGPDGNMVSNDRLVRFPLGLRWIGGLPKNVNSFASVRGWVLAGGRCYIVGANVLENLAASAPDDEQKPLYLICRDAHNGLPLWRIPLGIAETGGGLNWQNAFAMAADRRHVYAAGDRRVLIVDGASGKIGQTIETAYQPQRLVLLDDTLVVSCWEQRDCTKAPFERGTGAGPWVNTTDRGSVEAFDAETGRRLWKRDFPAYAIRAAEGAAYLLTRNANPATENRLISVDIRSGKQRWCVTHADLGTADLKSRADLQLELVGPGFVAVAKRQDEALKVLDARTGRMLWYRQYSSTRPGHWNELRSYRFIALVDGELWSVNRRHNPLTGEVLGELPEGVPKIAATICVPPTIVGNLVSDSRYCRYLELSGADRSVPRRTFEFHAARGGCLQGMVPAMGMMTTSQNNCGCEPGQILGFLAFGHNGELPDEEAFGRARPVERGPAFDEAKAGPPETDAWPMQRANAQRSRSTNGSAPESLDILWQASAAVPHSGPMQPAWGARLAPVVTPPVVAGGRVFVAATELGQVKAFDAVDGKALWTATLASRVDSAPTILGNLCVVGAHDGWLYALLTDTGTLAWRARIAPAEHRIVVHGRIESTWPTVGSPLPHGGTLFAHAGRGTEADGGIAVVQLDPTTGRTLWAGAIGPGARRRIDLLRAVDGTVACNETAIEPASGILQRRQIKASAPGGLMLDGYLGRAGMRGFDSAGETVRAVAGERVVVAGSRPFGGAVQLVDEAGGERIASADLESPPIYDGLAVAGRRVFVALEDGNIVCLGQRE